MQGGGKAVVTLLAAAAVLAPAPSADARPPSFIHVLTDDQTVDSIRHMPHTRRLLAGEGTRFENFHVTGPLCCPSRASFLTGQYPHNHGVLSNTGPEGPAALDYTRTLYTALHDAGYRTGWIGKLLNPTPDDPMEPGPGFDEWLIPTQAGVLDMFDYELNDNGTVRRAAGPYQNTVFVERALEFLDETPRHRPFILTLASSTPHWTKCRPGDERRRCPPTPDHLDRGSFAGERFPFGPNFRGGRKERRKANQWWRRELESLQSVDRTVRDLVGALRTQGRLDRTYVILQSDNGHLHGQHGVFDKNAPWDRSVRVPLLIRGPRFAAGVKRDDLTANVDLPLTILELAGVDPPLPPDGHSLLGDRRRRILLVERLRGPERRRFRLLKHRDGWTFWRNPVTGRRHLYDLRSDPYQVRNLAKKRTRVAKRLERRVDAIAGCANPCP